MYFSQYIFHSGTGRKSQRVQTMPFCCASSAQYSRRCCRPSKCSYLFSLEERFCCIYVMAVDCAYRLYLATQWNTYSILGAVTLTCLILYGVLVIELFFLHILTENLYPNYFVTFGTECCIPNFAWIEDFRSSSQATEQNSIFASTESRSSP